MTRPGREAGRQTRAALREAALALFVEQGYEPVTMAAIANQIGGYPNQVTHHFGSKDALFAEASGLAILRAARHAEQAAVHADSIESHARILIASLLGPGASSVMMFAEAMLMARNKAALRPSIQSALDRLHAVGEATLLETLSRHRWKIRTSPEMVTRAFWASVLGLALEKAATGDAFEHQSAEAVALSMMNLNQDYIAKIE
ncbi:TetR family transcriptional regulator [Variovorax gossypii]|uniref:TetR family transcriptional regulator n=1 Tax=Variovorax gossypii TaxID=1679495 RepID=A0A3S0GXQ5_9BURK|nr:MULTISPECIES: TetR/AcrR family transcriptional regulator C-terminal domain-containing protein [Variovorax]RTQ35592.1 TetR family transcriptional regulator [Variovorax gossypii]